MNHPPLHANTKKHTKTRYEDGQWRPVSESCHRRRNPPRPSHLHPPLIRVHAGYPTAAVSRHLDILTPPPQTQQVRRHVNAVAHLHPHHATSAPPVAGTPDPTPPHPLPQRRQRRHLDTTATPTQPCRFDTATIPAYLNTTIATTSTPRRGNHPIKTSMPPTPPPRHGRDTNTTPPFRHGSIPWISIPLRADSIRTPPPP
ncbi:hypothetical protein EDB85DRAFT_2141136 [Lactarius pseudohatsudake]|nr:hypothetical protein EDB85DRAFT_2141136 [Lactarius pseudohatsudake]